MQETSIIKKITVTILGLLLCIVMLEAGIRIVGFIFLSSQEYRNRISIKQKGTYCIMCLGDSMTAGMWPRPLEEILNERIQGIKFTVIDKAKPAVTSEFIISTLSENLDKYNPDMVIVMTGFNDGKDLLPYGNIPTSKEIPFKIYKLARILWYHIVNKAGEAGVFIASKEKEDISDRRETLMQADDYEGLVDRENEHGKAISMKPNDDRAYVELGWWYRDLGKYDKAEGMFKKAIEINPKNDCAYLGLGWCHWFKEKYDKAEGMFKKAIEINPKNDWAYAGLGERYNDQGEYDKAEEVLQKAIEINPKNDRAYFGLGWCYIRQGEYDKAEEILKKDIETNLIPPDRVYGSLANCYKKWGKYKLAEEYFRKANRLGTEYYNPITCHNYQRLKEIVTRKGIKLVCVQYPMCSVEPLKKMFRNKEGIIFVDNEKIFKKALKQASYDEYFRDMYGGGFGHCTNKGNRLLAENIADVILKEGVF